VQAGTHSLKPYISQHEISLVQFHNWIRVLTQMLTRKYHSENLEELKMT